MFNQENIQELNNSSICQNIFINITRIEKINLLALT